MSPAQVLAAVAAKSAASGNPAATVHAASGNPAATVHAAATVPVAAAPTAIKRPAPADSTPKPEAEAANKAAAPPEESGSDKLGDGVPHVEESGNSKPGGKKLPAFLLARLKKRGIEVPSEVRQGSLARRESLTRRAPRQGVVVRNTLSAPSFCYGNIPTLPAADWSVMGIYPHFLRLIGPLWEYTRRWTY
eukprot:4205483-Pyramimonas_sp.AAC.1